MCRCVREHRVVWHWVSSRHVTDVGWWVRRVKVKVMEWRECAVLSENCGGVYVCGVCMRGWQGVSGASVCVWCLERCYANMVVQMCVWL